MGAVWGAYVGVEAGGPLGAPGDQPRGADSGVNLYSVLTPYSLGLKATHTREGLLCPFPTSSSAPTHSRVQALAPDGPGASPGRS